MPLSSFSLLKYEAHCYLFAPLRFEPPIQQGGREAFLISWSYGMGDPMAPSEGEGNSEGGREMSRPGALGTKEKIPMTKSTQI
jgi:hypothetical protein